MAGTVRRREAETGPGVLGGGSLRVPIRRRLKRLRAVREVVSRTDRNTHLPAGIPVVGYFGLVLCSAKLRLWPPACVSACATLVSWWIKPNQVVRDEYLGHGPVHGAARVASGTTGDCACGGNKRWVRYFRHCIEGIGCRLAGRNCDGCI